MPEDLRRSSFGGLRLPAEALEQLTNEEEWWRDHQEWLAQKGYMLRPRYRPGWKPSWKDHPDKRPATFEDWRAPTNISVLDAVRSADNSLVAIKQLRKEFFPHELEVAQYLYSDELRSDPRNHTVPILDVLPVPDDPTIILLVMPLMRPCDDPPWDTVGEVVSFITQILEGLQFMHEHNVAHRDCMDLNIMYDPRPVYPDMYHPIRRDLRRDFKRKAKHSTRTAHPVRYYYIDFGLSRRYNPEDGPPREHPIVGGDKSVPEFKDWKGELLDPFPTDIYYIGNMMLESIVQRYRGVGFMTELVKEMVQADPSKRPTIQEVARRFDELKSSLPQGTLRSRLVQVNEDPALTPFRNLRHHFRTLGYVLLRKAAIPVPS